MNIYEIIRRWHGGQTISAIATSLTLDRKTVRIYINMSNRWESQCSSRGRDSATSDTKWDF